MPTECSADLLGFARVEGRSVVAAFDGGKITSDAGGLLLGATERAIGLVGRFARCFSDSRSAELVEHTSLIGPESYVAERIAAYREAGVSTLLVTPMAPGHEGRVRLTADEIVVLDNLRERKAEAVQVRLDAADVDDELVQRLRRAVEAQRRHQDAGDGSCHGQHFPRAIQYPLGHVHPHPPGSSNGSAARFSTSGSIKTASTSPGAGRGGPGGW